MKRSKSHAPGKLILTGEYAVLRGLPAIACAINRYTATEISENQTSDVTLYSALLSKPLQISWKPLHARARTIAARYQAFCQQQLTIEHVLQQPEDLVLYALHYLCRTFKVALAGLTIQIQSDLPVGSGLGSSAALIVSLVHAFLNFIEHRISDSEFLTHCLHLENFQHGKSSGFDLETSFYGGVRHRHRGAISLPLSTFYLINTGKPTVSTGMCVEFVRAHYPETHPLWAQFQTCITTIEKNLSAAAIMENERLLEELQVVPAKVAIWIHQLHQHHIAAKVCGAGAISGDAAGVVWALEQPPLTLIAPYQLETVSLATRGVHAI